MTRAMALAKVQSGFIGVIDTESISKMERVQRQIGAMLSTTSLRHMAQ